MFVRTAQIPHQTVSAKPIPNRDGTAVVEFALVAPLIFLFVLGMIETGRGFMVAHMLNNVAREGCRSGLVMGTSSAQIQQTVKTQLEKQQLTGASTQVLVNGKVADAATAKSGDRIAVNVSIPVSQFTWVPGGRFLNGSITGSYTLRRE